MVELLEKAHAEMASHIVEAKECLVCMDADRSHILEPCRHAVACEACSRSLLNASAPCPVCRTPIAAVTAAAKPITHTFVGQRQ